MKRQKGARARGVVRAPGALASTCMPGIWDTCFAAVKTLRSGLSSLLHSILRVSASNERALPGKLWPMPFPLAEVHLRRYRGDSEEAQWKLGVNFMVLVLNWLAMGEKLAEVGHIALGVRQNGQQREVTLRLASFVRAWNSHAPVTSEAMGRSAAKVESIEEVIRSLEEASTQPARELRSYLGKVSSGKVGDWGQCGHPGAVVGQLRGGVDHVAKDVEPERYKFYGRPDFEASEYLDEENRDRYLHPLDHARMMDPDDPTLPRVKVRGSRKNQLKLLEVLDQTGRLALLTSKEVEKGFENGLFSIPKDAEKDRMVLDARRPNSREQPEQRWIYSLGSTVQLQHLFLEEDQVLLLHAEDLRDYYHSFKVSSQRIARNALKMRVAPSQVAHLSCFHADLASETELTPCLRTMAMGDVNAVAFGQTAHLAVILRTGELRLRDFLSLRMRPSREDIRAGLMIDDFLVFEVMKKHEVQRLREGQRTRGGQIVDRVRQAYEEAGLVRHSGKAVEQSLQGEVWGLEVDGERGIAKPNPKRVIPLMNIILRTVQLGKASVALLEVLAGAICSVFQSRRRLMSLLHEIYAAQRGREREDVVLLSRELRDEMMMCLALIPAAVIDFRLAPSPLLIATDASSSAEAAVAANVGEKRTKEFQRYGLQKGLWNRLLSPAKALIREKALEDEDVADYPELAEQLPGEHYEMHPLWQEVVQSCSFSQFGEVRRSMRREHINLKEVAAALDAEERHGRQYPSTYFVNLQDSQVSLACLVKGRSSSWAINKKLRKSIPTHLSYNTRPVYGYVRSKLNPADDPTRNHEVRAASKPQPEWWQGLEEDEFDKFDSFLKKFGVDVEAMADLPSEDELMPSWDFNVRSSKQEKADRGRARRKKPRREDPDRLRPEDTRREEEAHKSQRITEAEAPGQRAFREVAEDEMQRLADQGIAGEPDANGEAAACPRDRCCAVPQDAPDWPVNPLEPQERKEHASAEDEEKDAEDLGGSKEEDEGARRKVSAEAKQILLSLPADQFVLAKEFHSVAEALEAGPGLLDLFSGQRGFAKALVRRGAPWALCWDLKHSPKEDLLLPRNKRILFSLVRSGAFLAMASSPVCASFSTAITPPWRTCEHPMGRPDLNEEQKRKIELGHQQLELVLALALSCLEHGVHFWIENPDGSWMWKLGGKYSWEKILQTGKVADYRTDQCRHGTPWRKRTKFRTTTHLGGQRQLCRCKTAHTQLRGRCREAGMNYTKLAESYPRPLCDLLACAMSKDCGWQPLRRRVSVSDVARCKGARIGEAQNPGPRVQRSQRSGTLHDVELLEPETVRMRARFWATFNQWLDDELGSGSLDTLLLSPIAFVKALEGYAHHQYARGVPLHYYRQLLAHVQKEYPLVRPFMSSAWSLVSKWEIAEPVQHRPPVPEPLIRAMATLAIAWGWPNFAATILLAFYGICRMGEVLKATRAELLTPLDLLEDESRLYLRIEAPKTRRRGARVQYTTVDEEVTVKLVQVLWQHLRPEQRLCGISPSSFRRRWDALLDVLGLERHHRITPGSVRGGGAVWAHRKGVHITDIMWKMRLQNVRTLTFYLQETTAMSLLPSLNPTKRSTIHCLQRLLPFFLDAVSSKPSAKNVDSAHGFSWLAT